MLADDREQRVGGQLERLLRGGQASLDHGEPIDGFALPLAQVPVADLGAIERGPDRCFVVRGAGTGDRLACVVAVALELAGLTWRALDLDGARLSVEQQLVPTRGGATFGPPKSKRSRRTVALDPETVAMLRRHRETQLLERDFAGPAYDDGDLVFADQLGGSIHPQRLTQWFSEHRKAAGITTGSLHVLRHTAATLALTSGVPVHIVAARLGDDPKQILGTYAHLLPQSDEMAAERIATALVAQLSPAR